MGYAPRVPDNYDEVKRVGGLVSDRILAGKVPEPEHVSIALGPETVSAYYLMHALLHSIDHKRGKNIPEYRRRDGKPIQRHSYDAAFKPIFRLYDNDPSNYLTTTRERRGILVHDLGEEFGEDLLGATVVNELIKKLISEEAGRDADLLTNKNALLYSPLEDEVSKMPDINHSNVYSSLARLGAETRVTQDDVLRQYRRVDSALRRFRTYVKTKVHYMSGTQKNRLIATLDDFIARVDDAINHGTLEAQIVNDIVTQQYQHVMSLMSGQYPNIDQRLLPKDVQFLAILKRLWYKDYLAVIARAVKIEARQHQQSDDDSYVSPMIIKVAEATDTVTNMDTDKEHAVNISGKAQTSIETSIELIEHLRQRGYDYQRLQAAAQYLFSNFDGMIRPYLEFLREISPRETARTDQLNAITAVSEQLENLERRLNNIEGSGRIVNALRGWRSGGLRKAVRSFLL